VRLNKREKTRGRKKGPRFSLSLLVKGKPREREREREKKREHSVEMKGITSPTQSGNTL
jgi:hypothetical protein